MRFTLLRKSFLLLSLLGMSIAYGSLPDEINHVEYKEKYLDKKSISDGLHSQADSIKNSIFDTQNSIESLKTDIQNLERRILLDQEQIKRSQADILQSENDNRELAFRNQLLREEISRLEFEIRNKNNEITSINSSIGREEDRLRILQHEYDEVNTRFSRISDKLKEIEKDVDQLNRRKESAIQKKIELISEKEKLVQRLRKIVQVIPELKNKIEQNKIEKSEKERELLVVNSRKAKLIEEENQIKQNADRIRDNLNRLKDQHRPLLSEINGKKRELSQKKSELSSLESQINELSGKIGQLEQTLSNLPALKRQLETSKAKLENEANQIESNLNKTQIAIGSANEIIQVKRVELRALTQGPRNPDTMEKIKVLRNEISDLQTKIQSLENAKNKLESQKSSKLIEIEKVVRELNNFHNKERELKQSIADKKNKKNSLESRQTGLQAEVIQIKNELIGLEQSAQEVLTKIANVESRLNEINVKLNEKQQQLKNVSQRIDNLTQNIDRLNIEINEKTAKVSSLEKEVSQTEQEIVRTDNKISNTEKSLAEIINNLNFAISDLRKIEQRFARVSREFEQVKISVNDQLRVLDRLERERQILVDQLRGLEANNAKTRDELNLNEGRIAGNLESISKLRQLISALEEEIAQFHTRISDNTNSIENLKIELADLERNFALVAQKAKNAQAETDSAFGEYDKRQKLYNLYLSKAQKLGADRGSGLGKNKGEVIGVVDANEQAAQNGNQIGMEVAFLDGRFRGLIRGKLLGHEIGYKDGTESEQDFNKGFLIGKQRGIKKAEYEAVEVDFPIGYKNGRADLLNRELDQNIKLSNNEISDESLFNNLISEMIETRFKSLETLDETDVSDEEIERANSILSNIDQYVQLTIESKKTYDDVRKNLSHPSVVFKYLPNVDIDQSALDCRGVYKNIKEFTMACESSYNYSYISSLQDARKKKYYEVYGNAYKSSYDNSFGESRNTKFSEAKKKSYEVVYNEAFLKGAEIAFSHGISEGAIDGYESRREDAGKEQQELGEQKANLFFQENGVIRLTNDHNKSKIVSNHEKGLIQGSSFNGTLYLRNLGLKNSKANNVTLKILSFSNNLELDNRINSIRSLPGDHNIELENVLNGKIKENAIPGSELIIKAQLSYPGDDITSSFTENVEFRDFVKVNPEVGFSLNYDKNPKWRKWKLYPFSWKFREHAVEVVLKGLRNHIPSGYKVNLKILEGQEYVDVVNSEVHTRPLGENETENVKLSYKFIKKKAKEKTLKFQVTISYEEKVINSTIIDMISQ